MEAAVEGVGSLQAQRVLNIDHRYEKVLVTRSCT